MQEPPVVSVKTCKHQRLKNFRRKKPEIATGHAALESLSDLGDLVQFYKDFVKSLTCSYINAYLNIINWHKFIANMTAASIPKSIPVTISDGATRRMSPTSSPRSVSNENRFQFLVYRESKITYHIPDKQLKLSQKHKCGDFMWLNTVMSLCV